MPLMRVLTFEGDDMSQLRTGRKKWPRRCLQSTERVRYITRLGAVPLLVSSAFQHIPILIRPLSRHLPDLLIGTWNDDACLMVHSI